MNATRADRSREDDAELVLRWIRSGAIEMFTLRQCHQRLRGRFHFLAQLEPVVDRLVALGHLEPVAPPRKVGRPPRLFRVLGLGTDR